MSMSSRKAIPFPFSDTPVLSTSTMPHPRRIFRMFLTEPSPIPMTSASLERLMLPSANRMCSM